MRSAVGHNFLVKIATGVRQSLKSLCDHACERHGEEEVELDLAECQRSLRIEVVHRHVLASSPISKATKLPQGSVHGISRPPAGREVRFRRDSAKSLVCAVAYQPVSIGVCRSGVSSRRLYSSQHGDLS